MSVSREDAGRPHVVLVYGGDLERRRVTARALVETAFTARVASGMAEAAKALAAGGVALIALLPDDIDGAGDSETTRLAVQLRAAFGLPVVVMTGADVSTYAELVRTTLGAHSGANAQPGESA